jgi:phosphoglycerol geranylgeranyltransferase
MKLYEDIFLKPGIKLSLLIDPDKHDDLSLESFGKEAQNSNIDFLLLGGSILHKSIDNAIKILKSVTQIPVILFPGNLLQLSNQADGILFLSLLSGRNADLLIGNHVIAAPFLKNSQVEILSTGYILIDGGNRTSVEYMSNTRPIPADKADIVIATAMAGEMIGNKLIYLEAGSGAKYPVSLEIISQVKKNISIPVIVGGGIRTEEDIYSACKAGADVIVV